MTPAQRVIKSRNDEIVRGWNRARFRRLASILEVTEAELGEMAYLPTFQLRQHLRANKFSAPVAGHLENIERYAKASRLKVRFEKGTAQDMVLQEKIKEAEETEKSA